MAGVDEIITVDKIQIILKQAKGLALDSVKAQNYVLSAAVKHNWKVDNEPSNNDAIGWIIVLLVVAFLIPILTQI
jgi:hypothetical protein